MGLATWLGTRKRYWLLPLVMVVVLFLLLLVLGQGSREDFVYTLF